MRYESHESPYLYALTADPNKPLREAQETIARLTAERDEARREVCWLTDKAGKPTEYAAMRGWDCFKEGGK